MRLSILLSVSLLLVGCGGGEDRPDEPDIPASGIWYEADFADPGAAARHHHTVVVDLEPANYIGEPLENLVRYQLDVGTYRFCIDPDDEFITGFTLENDAGEVMLTLDRFNECVERDLPAGIYTKRIRHDGDEVVRKAAVEGEQPQNRVAFVQSPSTPRITDNNGQPLGGWWVVALGSDQKTIITTSLREPPLDFCGPDDYPDPVPCPARLSEESPAGITAAQLFRFDHRMQGATVPVSMQVGVVNKTLPSPLFVFFYFGADEISAHIQDKNTAGCPIDVYSVWGGSGYLLATQGASLLNTACKTGTLLFNDLGGYTFQLYVLEPYHTPPVKAGVYRSDSLVVISNVDWEPVTLQVLMRLFRPEDGDDTAAIADNLQEGEVALFEDCNYGGKMWVLGQETADFSRLSGPGFQLDNAISSVRVSQNTTAILYSDSHYQGKKQEIIADTPCLEGSTIGNNTASALQFGKALDILISSNQCVGCKLAGVQLPEANLRNVDLRQADLRGANFFRAKLRKAKLNDAVLSGDDTNLNFAELRQAVLTGAKLDSASLEGADLRQATLTNADLSGAKLSKAHIYQKIDLTRTTLDGADFSEALMAEVKFSGSLKRTIFNRAVLVNAEFDNSVLDTATFNGAWLVGVNFTGATSINSVHLTNACVSTQAGVWSFPELRRSFRYDKTVLGPLATDTSVFCPNGQNRIQCCPDNDTGQCAAAALTPTDPGADLHNPKAPPCLPDQAALDDPEADNALLCPPPQLNDKPLQNCSILQ